MKRTTSLMVAACFLVFNVVAQPKYEFRAAWIATVR